MLQIAFRPKNNNNNNNNRMKLLKDTIYYSFEYHDVI